MQKVTQFLEKNVEWFCLGIAVLFALWCVWAYILTPVSRKMGPNTATLDNVDNLIKTGSAAELERQMSGTDVPVFKVEQFSESIRSGLALTSFKSPVLEARWDFQPLQLSTTPGSGPLAGGPKIKQLPLLPKLNFLFTESGMSTVDLTPAAAGGVAPAPAGGAAGPAPAAGGIDAGLAAPPAAAPAAAGAAPAGGGVAAPGADHTDINWVTLAFSLPSKPLGDEWKKSFGPEKDGDAWKLAETNTQFLTLTAYRSEKLANGKWGPDVEVARLPNNPLNPYPAATDKKAEQDYADWAKTNTPAIIAPPIPPLAPAPAGTEWKDPPSMLAGLANTAAAPAAPAAAPVQAPPPAAAPARGGRAPVARGPAPATPRGRGAAPAPVDAPVLDVTTPAAPAAGPATPAGPMPADIQKNDALSAADLTAVAVTKDFNPYADKQATPDILVYLHDNVQPGKTYRYQIGYRLYNPLFNFGEERATDKSFVSQFALEGPRSEWTREIAVAPRTFFYCAQADVVAALRGAPFNFEVITWSQGQWHKHTFAVSPGDQIGAVDNGIDYATGYTFIEARYRNVRQTNVLMADADGNIIVRVAAQDANGADRKAKEALVPAAAPAAPVAAPPAAPPADAPAGAP
jgi:hypothetical protein